MFIFLKLDFLKQWIHKYYKAVMESLVLNSQFNNQDCRKEINRMSEEDESNNNNDNDRRRRRRRSRCFSGEGISDKSFYIKRQWCSSCTKRRRLKFNFTLFGLTLILLIFGVNHVESNQCAVGLKTPGRKFFFFFYLLQL